MIINLHYPCTDWESLGISAISGIYDAGPYVDAVQIEVEKAVELIGGKGKVAVLEYKYPNRYVSFPASIFAEILSNYSDVSFDSSNDVISCDTMLEDDVKPAVSEYLSENDPDIILCATESLASIACKAEEIEGKVLIVGLAEDHVTDDFANLLKEGSIAGFASTGDQFILANGLEAAVQLLNGEDLDSTIIPAKAEWVDNENIDNYLR